METETKDYKAQLDELEKKAIELRDKKIRLEEQLKALELEYDKSIEALKKYGLKPEEVPAYLTALEKEIIEGIALCKSKIN